MKGVIYCDGGSNQFGSIYCVISEFKHQKWASVRRFKTKYNVMQIEYLALIAALEKCSRDMPLIYTDNLRVSKEANSKRLSAFGSKNRELWKRVRKLMRKKRYAQVKWISRTQNFAGVYLEEILWKKKEEKFGIPRSEMKKIYKILNERKRMKQGQRNTHKNHQLRHNKVKG